MLRTKRWADLAGGLVVAVSLAFVGQRLWAQAAEVGAWQVGVDLRIATAVGGVIYAAAGLLLAVAWHRLVLLFGVARIPLRVTVYFYTKSQIAKYIPGNVAHLAARHALGRNLGFTHGALVASAVAELFGLAAAASALALFAVLVADIGRINRIGIWSSMGLLLGATLFFLFLPFLWNRLQNRYRMLPALGRSALRRASAAVFALYLLYFLVAGSTLALLVAVGTGRAEPRGAVLSLAVFAVAWLVGLVTPGAPSGIGVREAVIVLALDHLAVGGESLLIALLLRFATVGGDVLLLLFFLGARPKSPGERTD